MNPGQREADLDGDAANAAAPVPGRRCVQQTRENLETTRLSSTPALHPRKHQFRTVAGSRKTPRFAQMVLPVRQAWPARRVVGWWLFSISAATLRNLRFVFCDTERSSW